MNSILKSDYNDQQQVANPVELNKNISLYKKGQIIDFKMICSIPVPDRIPGLVDRYGVEKIHALIVVMLADFCNYYNVIRPMNANQIVSCAYEIMNSANEDFISVEDLALFFHGAKQGRYGRVLDHLDNHVIFEMLNSYRDERHKEYMRLKESRDAELSGLGPSERTTANNPLEESMYNIVGRLDDMKEKLKEQREINRASRL